MKPTGSRIYDFLLLATLALFVALKIPSLGLPYFWDELGVYTRASYYLAGHGMGLLPSQLPPELSRGHPLLFPFIYGVAYRLFGFNVYVGHTVSLIVSVCLLGSFYYMLKKIASPAVALLTVILLSAQPVFFALSVMVLPEMMVTMLVMWGLYCVYRKHYWVYAITAGAAIMIKESAIVVPASVFFWSILNWVFLPDGEKYLTVKRVVLSLSPLLIFGLFLIIQKYQNGWYFFPLHTELISFDCNQVFARFQAACNFIFAAQGRTLWIFILAAAILILLLKRRVKVTGSFTGLALVFICVYMAFCSVNFYMDRYALVAIPVIAAMVIMALKELWNNLYFMGIVTGLLTAASITAMNPDGFNYDCDMSYQKVLIVERQAAEYVAENINPSEKVGSTFPMNVVLSCANTGFNLHRYYPVIAVQPFPEYLVEDNEVGTVNVPRNRYSLIKQFKCGFAGVNISRYNSGK